MPFKNNPGCGCCEPIVETCSTKYLSGWRFGTGNVVKTIHEDFTATYVDYTQREEREYDSGNNLISTTVISQTYPNAYSSASSVTESVENDKFYSGEFIANTSDSFKSESLVSSVPQPGGGKIDTYDVVYDRSADVRVSSGIALFEGNHPQLSSFASGSRSYLTSKVYWVNYANQSLGTYTEDISWLNFWSVIGNSASRIWPTGYSVDPDSIGDGNETVYVTFSSGVSNATATAANSRSSADALRGSGSEGADSLTYNSSYNVDSEFEVTSTVYSNGSEYSICVVGQKNSSVNGPAGSGFSKQDFSFGYESFYDNYTPFSSQETRPQITIWDFIDSKSGTATGTNGPTQIEFTVPADSGIRIKYAREVYNDIQNVKLFDGSKTTPFLNANPNYQYLAGVTSVVDTYGPLAVSDSESPDDLWEHKSYTPGAYPWPLKTSSKYLFNETLELFPENPAGSGLNSNLVSVRVDSGIAPTYRVTSNSSYPSHLQFNPTSKTRYTNGIPVTTPSVGLSVWNGGNYVCEITDYKGFVTIDYIELVQFDQTIETVPCDEITGCSDTLGYTSNNLVHRTSNLKFDVSSLYGGLLQDWLYYNTSPNENYPSYVFNVLEDWVFEETTGCQTSVTWHFDGSTYTTNLPVVEASVSISGAMDNADIDLTIELVRLHSGASIDGPYSMTMSGIDLTAISGTSIADNAGLMSIELGVDDAGNYSNANYNIRSGPSGYGDLLGAGSFSSGSSPFPVLTGYPDTYVIRVSLNNKFT